MMAALWVSVPTPNMQSPAPACLAAGPERATERRLRMTVHRTTVEKCTALLAIRANGETWPGRSGLGVARLPWAGSRKGGR